MKVAHTGATGFVGSDILAGLREHDHEVTALVRNAVIVTSYDRPTVVMLVGGSRDDCP